MYFPGSRDDCPLCLIVESNYPGRELGEVQVKINGPISFDTLKEVVQWVENETITDQGVTKLRVKSTTQTLTHHEPVYLLGVSGASWHYQEREDWRLQENLTDPEYPFLSTSSISGSGLTETEARELIKVGCICYDLSEDGLTGAVSACSLPTRSLTKTDSEHAWAVWNALLKMKEKFPKMKLGIAKEDKKFPWE
jgi:hypothetical protein